MRANNGLFTHTACIQAAVLVSDLSAFGKFISEGKLHFDVVWIFVCVGFCFGFVSSKID